MLSARAGGAVVCCCVVHISLVTDISLSPTNIIFVKLLLSLLTTPSEPPALSQYTLDLNTVRGFTGAENLSIALDAGADLLGSQVWVMQPAEA